MALRSFFFTAILICEAADSAKFDSKHKKVQGGSNVSHPVSRFMEEISPPGFPVERADFLLFSLFQFSERYFSKTGVHQSL